MSAAKVIPMTTPPIDPPTGPRIKAVRFTHSISLPSVALASSLLRDTDAALQVSVRGIEIVKGEHHYTVPMTSVEYIAYYPT